MKLDLTASIAAFQTKGVELNEALVSVNRSRLRTSTFVVDNSPTDDLKTRAELCGAQYVKNGRNVGFGAAHNQIFERVRGLAPYHLVLNPDVTFQPGVLEELHEFMEENPRVGWVMPSVRYPDGSEQHLCKRFASPLDLVCRRFRPAGWTIFGDRLARYRCEDLDLSYARYVPSLSGCFMFLRAEAMVDVGPFDERYFLYLEDFDYARRMAGRWDTAFYPYVSICHGHAKGSYRDVGLLTMHLRSAVRYFNKWGWIFDSERARINGLAEIDARSYELPGVAARSRS